MNELKKLITLLTNKEKDMSVILEHRENQDHRQQQGSGYTPDRQSNYEQQRMQHQQYMTQQQWQYRQHMLAQQATLCHVYIIP
jgi:hypothetical protein